MPIQDDRPAAEVFAIIEEPTAQTGPIRTVLLKIMAAVGGQVLPSGTHPVVVHRATGKKVKGGTVALTALIEEMQQNLGTMTAGEFRNRYLNA